MNSLNPLNYCLTAIGIFAIGVTGVFGSPAFMEKPFFDGGEGVVTSVEQISEMDVVFFRGGLSSGFRNGMLCEVLRDTNVIAKMIIVEVKPDTGASLILKLYPEFTIRPGDRIHLKTRKQSILS